MINRDIHKELSEKYESVKKQYSLGREQYAQVQRDADYWETQAKTLRTRNEKLEAQVKLWQGTGL